jgi:predicted PurR-regulated permease PerM
MIGSAFGIGTPMTQPNLSFAPFFTPYAAQQPQVLQQITQLLQTVPQQLQQLQQLQYLQQHQLQQIQQFLQVIPAQLAQIQQQIQFVPQQIQQQGQPFLQAFGQVPGGLGAASPWGVGSSLLSGQPGQLM